MIGILAILAATVAEALAFYCGAEIFANGYDVEHTGAYAPNAVTFAVVALVGFSLPRIGEEFALPRRVAYAIVGIVTFLLLYGTFRIEFAGDLALWDWSWVADFLRSAEATTRDGAPAIFGGFFLIVCFARAAWRGGEDLELEAVPASLGIWLVLVLVVVIFGANSDRGAEIGRGAAAFFAFAVIAMALSQSALSGATIGRIRAGGVTGLLILGTVVATLLGLIVFGFFVGVAGDEIGAVIYTVVGAVAFVILTPVAWGLSWLFGLLIPEGAFFNQLVNDGILGEPEPLAGEDDATDEGEAAWQRFLRFLVRLGLIGIAAAIVIGLLVLVIRIKRRGERLREADPVHSTAGSLGADLAAGIRSLFSRGRHDAAVGAREGIYGLYAEILEDAGRRGTTRPPSRTPEEHAPALVAVYHTGVTDEITLAFEQARYAGRETDPHRVAELQRRWEQSRIVPGT